MFNLQGQSLLYILIYQSLHVITFVRPISVDIIFVIYFFLYMLKNIGFLLYHLNSYLPLKAHLFNFYHSVDFFVIFLFMNFLNYTFKAILYPNFDTSYW